MQKKRKRRIILTLTALMIAAFVILFWDSVIMFTAPKPALTAAINDAVSKLEERSQGSPFWVLAKGYDAAGKNTTLLQLKTSDSTLGEITYDMQVQTDLIENQLYAEGTVTTGGNSLDLSLYLDDKFAALTSDDLLQGGYYGITYDTFSADIRSFPLINFLIPSETIAYWEASVSDLQERMNVDYQLPQLPDIKKEDIRLLSVAILALKSEIDREEVQIYGQPLDCYKLTFSASGEQVSAVLGSLMDAAPSDDREISVSFYLYEKTLVKAELRGYAEEDSVYCALTLGQNAAEDDLSLVIIEEGVGEKKETSFVVSTKRTDSHYAETICMNDTVISYDWNTVTGDMTLKLPGKKPLSLNLTETEKGFCVITKDFAGLMGMDGDMPCDCTMTIRNGAEITTPVYKNMNMWSMDDLLSLLSGLGALVGFHTQ